ncbi:hypothetical protein [Halobellus clavatus]|jgi:hypothetical protein|uniref:Uncharacterized protein n=1 Tax=Halobellus clavatus TaxID=660517 RepID=A0A1H3HWP6_9EURY|nr:hypothetical protein [Halobellus clavatus]SDY19880.1 hypothetical protein SAMN04487946_108104 [Halobellus clavatus]
MIRSLIGLLGCLAAAVPGRLLDVFETLAVENADDRTRRSWAASAIRAEGVVVAAASRTDGRAYAWMLNLTGIFGGVVLIAPRLYRRFAAAFLYEDGGDVVWTDALDTGVRALGAVYVLLALDAFRERRRGE